MHSRTETMTASGMRDRLIAKATEDEAFCARLLSDPKTAIRDELGLAVPAGFSIKVYEDAADASHLVLPPLSQLEEADLEHVAGGGRMVGLPDNRLAREVRRGRPLNSCPEERTVAPGRGASGAARRPCSWKSLRV